MTRAEEEEARAAEYRQTLVRRQRARSALNRSLSGNAASAKAVRDGWEPVILARLEARISERENEDG